MVWFDFADDKGQLYYVFFPVSEAKNISEVGDVSAFLKPTIGVAPLTTVFHRDLTNFLPFDEAVLALLSIIFLLAVDALIGTVLLRTTGGVLSLSRFFIKRSVELTRSFRFRHIIRRRQAELRPLLDFLSISLVLFSLVLALSTIALTSRTTRPVTNAQRTLEIIQPVNPDWNAVRNDSLRSLNRPCTVMRLLGPFQGRTTINTCVLSTMISLEFEAFEQAEEEVNMTIISDLHSYGAEHIVRMKSDSTESESAMFSARAYVSFDDEQVRILKQRSVDRKSSQQVYTVHKNYVGYMYSAYQRATNDSRINLDFMKKLNFTSATTSGPTYKVAQIGEGTEYARAQSTRYESRVTALMPRGAAPLRFAQSVFKASTAIGITTADTGDLVENEGETPAEAVVWRENSRHLNWLSLLILSCCSLFVLFMLRLCLKPIAMQEIAGVMVKRAADDEAEREAFRSATEPKEIEFVNVSALSNDSEYNYGAETLVNTEWGREEYQEKFEPESPIPYM